MYIHTHTVSYCDSQREEAVSVCLGLENRLYTSAEMLPAPFLTLRWCNSWTHHRVFRIFSEGHCCSLVLSGVVTQPNQTVERTEDHLWTKGWLNLETGRSPWLRIDSRARPTNTDQRTNNGGTGHIIRSRSRTRSSSQYYGGWRWRQGSW